MTEDPADHRFGTLFLVATPIGNLGDLSPRAVEVLARADVVCCEDTRHTGRLLEHAGVHAHRLVALHGHNEAARLDGLVALLLSGATIALVSDAGTPLISDPGERLVAAAIAAGSTVAVVPGPSAALAGLIVAGFSTTRWRFEGFLPRKGPERRARLSDIAGSPCASVCYEAPHRLLATLGELAEFCGKERRVAIARELTKLHEEVWRGTLSEAISHASAVSPRGEHVIVIDAAPIVPGPDSSAITEALARLLEAGLDRRAAITAVETLLGARHRDVYEAALAFGERTKEGA